MTDGFITKDCYLGEPVPLIPPLPPLPSCTFPPPPVVVKEALPLYPEWLTEVPRQELELDEFKLDLVDIVCSLLTKVTDTVVTVSKSLGVQVCLPPVPSQETSEEKTAEEILEDCTISLEKILETLKEQQGSDLEIPSYECPSDSDYSDSGSDDSSSDWPWISDPSHPSYTTPCVPVQVKCCDKTIVDCVPPDEVDGWYAANQVRCNEWIGDTVPGEPVPSGATVCDVEFVCFCCNYSIGPVPPEQGGQAYAQLLQHMMTQHMNNCECQNMPFPAGPHCQDPPADTKCRYMVDGVSWTCHEISPRNVEVIITGASLHAIDEYGNPEHPDSYCNQKLTNDDITISWMPTRVFVPCDIETPINVTVSIQDSKRESITPPENRHQKIKVKCMCGSESESDSGSDSESDSDSGSGDWDADDLEYTIESAFFYYCKEAYSGCIGNHQCNEAHGNVTLTAPAGSSISGYINLDNANDGGNRFGGEIGPLSLGKDSNGVPYTACAYRLDPAGHAETNMAGIVASVYNKKTGETKYAAAESFHAMPFGSKSGFTLAELNFIYDEAPTVLTGNDPPYLQFPD
jgi:hypothetical protein